MPKTQPSDASVATATATVGLTVIVPAYNEEDRLAPTLTAIRAHLETLDAEWELIVVDDGSTDGTVALTEAARAEEPRIRLLSTPRKPRQGPRRAHRRPRLARPPRPGHRRRPGHPPSRSWTC
ncbi:hypothetical protein GCM10020000_42540 [Streptomyces olivoverticillatus]